MVSTSVDGGVVRREQVGRQLLIPSNQEQWTEMISQTFEAGILGTEAGLDPDFMR